VANYDDGAGFYYTDSSTVLISIEKLNSAPYFVETPITSFEIFVGEEWSYSLPEIVDND